jgi:hypothetical protein
MNTLARWLKVHGLEQYAELLTLFAKPALAQHLRQNRRIIFFVRRKELTHR